jgi:hypothetical protein
MERSNNKSAIARLRVDAARPVTVKPVPVLVPICVAGAVPVLRVSRMDADWPGAAALPCSPTTQSQSTPKIRDLAVNAPFTTMVATLTNRTLDG